MKALYAFDRVGGKEIGDVTEYYLRATKTVRASKEKYAQAEARANANRPSRPVWFHPYSYAEYDVSDGND